MKDFGYAAPKNVGEAISLLAELGDHGKVIAGGQSMLVIMKQNMLAPEFLVDIKGIAELDYINYDKKKGLSIGALTTHRTIERSPIIKKTYPVLSEMEDNLAVIQTRNWGTIGGNLCHGDPAGDPTIVFIALNAKLKIRGTAGEREIDIEDFYKDYLEVDLNPGELLVEIQVPPPSPHTGSAHNKLMVMKGDMGIVGTAVTVTVNPADGKCTSARIALSNVASTPWRSRAAENVLIGKVITGEVLSEAGRAASAELEPPADVHGSSEYRKEMTELFVRRTAEAALKRAQAQG
jgi:carbon-monoxide dehydrogenase medium subunit